MLKNALARYNSVRAVKEMFEEILATLEWVEGNDADGANAALGYIKEMQSKDFIFMLIVWEEILRKCNALSKQLQTVNMDMIEAIDLISLTKGALQIMRSDDAFKNRYEAAKEFSESNDVVFEENHEATRRVRRRKKFFDDPEGAQEVVMTDSDKQKVNYFEILDHIATEIEEKFEHFHGNISKFSYLSPKRIMSEEAVLQIEALAECYDGDVDASSCQ